MEAYHRLITEQSSSYSEAITVAIENAEDVYPEGKDRLDSEKPGPSHVSGGPPELGQYLCPANFMIWVKIPETTELSKLSKAETMMDFN